MMLKNGAPFQISLPCMCKVNFFCAVVFFTTSLQKLAGELWNRLIAIGCFYKNN